MALQRALIARLAGVLANNGLGAKGRGRTDRGDAQDDEAAERGDGAAAGLRPCALEGDTAAERPDGGDRGGRRTWRGMNGMSSNTLKRKKTKPKLTRAEQLRKFRRSSRSTRAGTRGVTARGTSRQIATYKQGLARDGNANTCASTRRRIAMSTARSTAS